MTDRVVVVTGTGNGLGRAHALAFAAADAAVITAGGRAVPNTDDISSWDGALINQAVDTIDKLDVLVNNAGILRDRMLASMTVHLKGTFCPTRHAAEYWRNRAKRGEASSGRAINTTSPSGLFGVSGQTNYVAAKAGIGRVGLADVLGLGSACAVQVLESHAA